MKNSYIHIQELSYNINTTKLYTNISAHIKAGDKAILLGANGSGKSTLFRIIQQQIKDYDGVCQTHGLVFAVDQEIVFQPQQTIVDWLQSNYPNHEERQFDLGLQAFGLDAFRDTPITQLSGGQRKKLQFVPTHFLEPDILLLDEPTNHLDTAGITGLQDFCKSWKGPLLCISHERAFIDSIATHIYALEHQDLIAYVGNYSGYISWKEQYDLAKLKEYESQQRDKKAMEQRLADLRQRASVYVNPARGRLLRSKEKTFARQFEGENVIEKPKSQVTMGMGQSGGVKGQKRIVQWAKQTITIDKNPLFVLPAGEIRGRERIHLKGANGSGKSSFLKQLYASHTELSTTFTRGPNIRILYLDQFGLDIVTKDSVRERSCRNFPRSRSETDIRGKLRGAGITADHLKASMQDLSFGQRTKIRFLQMMAQGYDLLLLDEPTNHLDIPTKELFEEMLCNYQGSVIIISHDEWTLRQLEITQVWEIIDGKLNFYQ